MLAVASAALVAVAALLTAPPATAETGVDWWAELDPPEYRGEGALTWSATTRWEVSGPLTGHPGTLHTGTVSVRVDEVDPRPLVLLEVRDLACAAADQPATCEVQYAASGTTTATAAFAPATGVIRVRGEVTDPSFEQRAPGVVPPPLDFDLTLTPHDFTPMGPGPRAADHVSRHREADRDSFGYHSQRSGDARVTGRLTGFDAAAVPLSASWGARLGDSVDLGRRVPPVTSARGWVPLRSAGSVQATAAGRLIGETPTTSTGFRLPGNALSATMTGEARRAAAGQDFAVAAHGMIDARECAPGQPFDACRRLGSFLFTVADPARYVVSADGRLQVAGSAVLLDASGTRYGELPVSLAATPKGAGRGVVSTTSDVDRGVRTFAQERNLRFDRLGMTAAVGSLRLVPAAGADQGMSFAQQFTAGG